MDTAADVAEFISANVGEDAAKVFEEADLNGKAFLMLKREDLQELLPGAKHFLTRKKIVHLIEASKLGQTATTPTATPEQPKVAVAALLEKPTLVPDFPIYKDESENVDRGQLVRITIGNMRTVTHNLQPPREPIPLELESMAKKLVAKYPMLADDADLNPNKPWEGLFTALKRRLGNVKPVKNPQGKTPNRGKRRVLTEEVNVEPNVEPNVNLNKNPQGMALYKGRKIDFAGEPVNHTVENASAKNKQDKHPQGNAPCKGKKRHFTGEVVNQTVETVSRSNPNSDSGDSGEAGDEPAYNAKDMAKHYDKIVEQIKKQKPNFKVIKQLMDLEVKSRRAWVTSINNENVTAKIDRITKAYPCFSYPCQTTELLEETRRLVVGGRSDPEFIDEAISRTELAWDRMFTYGLSSGKLDEVDPKSKDAKVTMVLTHLTSIFPGKKKSRKIASIIDAKKNLDKTVKSSDAPELLISSSHLLVVGGKRILAKIPSHEQNSWEIALLSLIGSYYTFDLGYEAGQENALLIIQSTILQDKVHPGDATKRYNKLLEEYSKTV